MPGRGERPFDTLQLLCFPETLKKVPTYVLFSAVDMRQ